MGWSVRLGWLGWFERLGWLVRLGWLGEEESSYQPT